MEDLTDRDCMVLVEIDNETLYDDSSDNLELSGFPALSSYSITKSLNKLKKLNLIELYDKRWSNTDEGDEFLKKHEHKLKEFYDEFDKGFESRIIKDSYIRIFYKKFDDKLYHVEEYFKDKISKITGLFKTKK
jgi:DNA-binding PadR family transcriptional regulator